MEPSNVDVSVSGDTLTIKGEKRQEKEEKEENYYLCERSFGSFQRSFTLPAGVDRDKIGSELAKGVLTITLPKTAEAQQQKEIEVKAG
jgi:HSP20 family protein